jgi:hypothetical protein
LGQSFKDSQVINDIALGRVENDLLAVGGPSTPVNEDVSGSPLLDLRLGIIDI